MYCDGDQVIIALRYAVILQVLLRLSACWKGGLLSVDGFSPIVKK